MMANYSNVWCRLLCNGVVDNDEQFENDSKICFTCQHSNMKTQKETHRTSEEIQKIS